MKLIPTSVNPVTITLYRGVPFDNSYREHTLISPRFRYAGSRIGSNVNEAFLNLKEDGDYFFPRTTKTGTYNFAFGNGLVTSVVMELTDNEINSNYMKVTSGTDNYYYFITGITQRNEITYLLNLELDVIETYGEVFLNNIEDNPVMVERKHCRRVIKKTVGGVDRNFVNPICMNQESTFSKLKPTILKTKKQMSFTDFVNGGNNYNKLMSELKWIYIIVGKGNILSDSELHYKENGEIYPYGVICFPTKNVAFTFTHSGNTYDTICLPSDQIEKYVENTAVQKIIISPFPPFKECSNLTLTFEDNFNGYNDVYHFVVNTTGLSGKIFSFYSGNNDGSIFNVETDNAPSSMTTNNISHIRLSVGYGGNFNYDGISNYLPNTSPTITSSRDVGEYKLEIAPFRDLRMSSFYGSENHIQTQYRFLSHLATSGWRDVKVGTIASSNPETNSYYDYSYIYDDLLMKLGVTSSVAYNLPTGSNAELLFNQTQENQYTNAKIVNAISNGLKIAGGIGAIALAPSVTAKVAGGLAIASGIEGEINTFTDWSAKMEDLRNTPNTYNFAGSSFSFDVAMQNATTYTTMLPYLLEYGLTDIEYQMGAEFLYHYGYEYNAMCYFNTALNNNNDNVFNRTIFTYVKIRDDIVGKMMGTNVGGEGTMPLIVAQKFNEILNAGITFWTFFNCPMLDTGYYDNVGYYVFDYFHQDTYCNAEVTSSQL